MLRILFLLLVICSTANAQEGWKSWVVGQSAGYVAKPAGYVASGQSEDYGSTNLVVHKLNQLPASCLTVEQFGGGIDKTPAENSAAIKKAIQASVRHFDYRKWNRPMRQIPIEFGPGVYQFAEPIEFHPEHSYQGTLVLTGKGAGFHKDYATTLLEFLHEDERPSIRISGNSGRIESLYVHAGPNSYCAIELGNDAWPGRLDEEGFARDLTCNRTVLREVGTWGGTVGISVRGWVNTLERIFIVHPREIGLRLAGNAITVRDLYYQQTRGKGVVIEHGSNITIQGGAIESGSRNGVCQSAGPIDIKKGTAIVVDNVYMEGQPYAVWADQVDGLSVRSIAPWGILPKGHSELATGNGSTTGAIVQRTSSTQNIVAIGFGNLKGRTAIMELPDE